MGQFGKQLRALRIARGMSQEEMAALLGTSKQVISRYENNLRSPKMSVASEYARILGVSLSTLGGESVDQPPIGLDNTSSRILSAMQKANLSYGDLSAITGIPKSALQRYATGETKKIPLYRIKAIAEAVGISAPALLGWSDSTDPSPYEAMPLLAETTSSRLRQLMAERGLKQIDILRAALPYSEEYGVKMNRSDISQYVSGKVVPRQDKLSVL